MTQKIIKKTRKMNKLPVMEQFLTLQGKVTILENQQYLLDLGDVM